jgi:CheY-like chemotaxis protein
VPAIEADRGQLQQLVMNLALNAAEAIGDNAGLISVQTGVQDIDGRSILHDLTGAKIMPGVYVTLEVRDTGCGMDEFTKARILDPFFTTKFLGRGLGLAAVGGIVRSHKGALIVQSTPGEGAHFTVLFPASDRPAAVSAPENLRETGAILVVDDEEVVRMVAKRTLERCGFTVLLADSARAAINVFKSEPSKIAAVLLDLSMPGMTGGEALPVLLKIRPRVKVIVSSGYGEDEAMKSFSGSPVSAFLQKPYTGARLAQKVKAAVA